LLFVLLLILLSLWFGGFQKGTKESQGAHLNRVNVTTTRIEARGCHNHALS
jgi:hypothetical protein